VARLALVTGAAQRIGAAICRHLHQQGFDIALHYRASRDSARQLAEELNGLRPDSCDLWQADLEQLADIRQLASRLLAAHPVLEAPFVTGQVLTVDGGRGLSQ
jgi:pteridine reductase